MTVLLFSIGLIGLFFVLMSVRLIFLKDGEFRGTCASQSPWLVKEGTACGYCGKTLSAGEACADPAKTSSSEFPEISSKK